MRDVFLVLFVLALLAGPFAAAPIPDPEGTSVEEDPTNEDHLVGEEIC